MARTLKLSGLSLVPYIICANSEGSNDFALRRFMGVKIKFIQIETSPGLGIIARWGPLPISTVLRSEGSLKSEMLSLARTSKDVKYVLSTNKSEEDS